MTAVHPTGLTLGQVAALMGISEGRARHIELVALEKLRVGCEAILAQFQPSDFELELGGVALEPEDFLLGMFELFDRHRRAEADAEVEARDRARALAETVMRAEMRALAAARALAEERALTEPDHAAASAL